MIISIIVPCYNCEKTIQTTVNSILSQGQKPDVIGVEYEVILVDDGSTDQTPEICDEYDREIECIKVIHQENEGLMRAWKNGVKVSSGEYVIFCDSDDYIDSDLIGRLYEVINQYGAELILYGMIEEYNNGDTVRQINRLPRGYYDSDKMRNEIFPVLFHNGPMQSEMIVKSRCSKAFKKALLQRIMNDLPDDISFSEDDLTTFACIVNTDDLYCMGDYCPYHYVRNDKSMIGSYDPYVFEKIERVYNEFDKLSDKYNYCFRNQILQDKLSTMLLFMKKEICRNPNGYKSTIGVLNKVRESKGFIECIVNCSIVEYSLMSRLFATLMIYKRFQLGYFAVKLFERIRGRNT